MVGRTLAALVIVASCRAGDASITHGADGDRECGRRLAAAVPLGMAADSARVTMERNGFRCTAGQDSVPYLWCDKQSASRGLVSRIGAPC
jgi:hypothetical protein